jgi:hypothetical protein
MKAFVLDREERCAKIAGAKRERNVIYYKDGEYAMRGVSWAWGSPMYPRRYFVLQFIPLVGPFLSGWLIRRDTFVFIAPGVPSTLEPRSNTLEQSMTDEQALAIMEAHAESMSIGRSGMNPILIVALGAMAVAGLAIVALLAR